MTLSLLVIRGLTLIAAALGFRRSISFPETKEHSMWPFKRATIDDIAPALPLSELKKRVKVLVVDDEEDSFPTQLLRDDGYTIEWWPKLDVPKLHRLESGDFDIVVLDIQGIADASLSDTGDGTGVLQRLKTVNPYQVVVAFSGKSYDLDSVHFWKLADETLRKPVSIIRAKSLLDRLIQERVSVNHYWDNVEAMLKAQGVPPKRIRRLEKELVRAGKTGKALNFEDVKSAVGSIDTLVTVYGFAQKIVALCRTLM